MRYTIALSTLICISMSMIEDLPAQENENIEQVGRIFNQWEYVADCDVVGELVYIAAGRSGLQIVDISNPDSLVLLGFWDDNPGFACGVAVSEGYAYLADGEGGLCVISVADPEHPVEVGFSDTPFSARKVAVSGDYVYIADGGVIRDGFHIGQCFRVFFVGDPERPQEIESFITPGTPYDVEISGDFAYVADYDHGLRIFSIDNPGQIREVGFLCREGQAFSVAVSGDYAFLGHGTSGMRVISVADPENPVQVAHYDIDGYVRKVFVSGDYVYLTERVLRILSVADPAHPREVANYSAPDYSSCFGVYGDLAFIDTKPVPDNPEIPGSAFCLLSVSDPENQEKQGYYSTVGIISDVAVTGDHIYVANGLGGLNVVSVDDREIVGHCQTPGEAEDVVVAGDYAYVVDVENGLRIISVENPEFPGEIGCFETGGESSDVFVSNDYAYLIDRGVYNGIIYENKGLYIINITDPENPTEAGYYNFRGTLQSVAVSGEFAYVSDGALNVLSITDPERITRVDYLDIYTNRIAVSGEYAYITGDGLQILSLADPAHPVEVGIIDTPYQPNSIVIFENYIYLTDDRYRDDIGYVGCDLHVLSITDPENPVEVGFYNTPGWALNVSVADDGLIYVADYSNVGIYRFTDPEGVEDPEIFQPAEFRLLAAYPNPFNSRTTICYALPHPGNVSLQLYNPLGQVIGTLFEGNKQAGIHSIDYNAGFLESGLYFIRLESMENSVTQKIILTK